MDMRKTIQENSTILQRDVLHPSRRGAADTDLGLFRCFGLLVCRVMIFIGEEEKQLTKAFGKA
jgi:hypothetical protein